MCSTASADPIIPLPQRTVDDTEGDVQRVLSKLDSSGNNKKILRVLANSPSTFRPVCAVDHGPALKRALPTTHTGGCHPSLGDTTRDRL